MSQVLAVDDSTFAIAVEGADAGLVLVDFLGPLVRAVPIHESRD